ncbi:unnamed protein product [Caenorhabditis angaria]|uniref:EGF-like domain-containing protein n=1 Tax=Caenorhabditis angaria TaxID=860376 RepID=A0A9P1INS3_9PELO|nr:unnamed protein product [Caenorhabditis angaria]
MRFQFLLALLLVPRFCQGSSSTVAVSSTVASSDSTTVVVSTVAGQTGQTTIAPGSTITGQTGGSTVSPGSTVTGGSTASGGSTVAESTVAPTTEPLILSTFQVSNDATYKDAQLILQQATLLNNQIASLNAQLIQAQKDTDPQNSPFFPQLASISANLTASNSTLQSNIAQLASLQTQQAAVDARISAASGTFTCFAESSCVTDVPTTAIPTTPGTTQPATACSLGNLTSVLDTAGSVNLDATYNTDCSFVIVTGVSTNSLALNVSVTITGNGYLTVTETRTGITTLFNQSTTSPTSINVTTSATIKYFADAYSSIAFSISYLETATCDLVCQNGGTCQVSQSGQQFCQCQACAWTGTVCEEPVNPCKTKQNRTCGGTSTTPYGVCYVNSCFDSCYACECVKSSTSPQKCDTPDSSTWDTPTPPTIQPTCAPTTVLFTTTVAQSTATGGSTVTGGSTATGATDSTETGGSTTVGSSTAAGSSTVAADGSSTVQSTVAPTTSTGGETL